MEESWENWHLHPEKDNDDDHDYFAQESINMEEDEEFLRQILLQTPAFSSESESDHSLHASLSLSEEIIGNMVKSNSSNSIVSSDQLGPPKRPRGSSSPKTYILSFDNSTMIPATPEGKILGSKKGSSTSTRRCSVSSSSVLPNKLQQVQNTSDQSDQKTRPNKQGTKRSRTTSQTIDHILAERKRRQELTERFIALSATIPGLSKTDKASVLIAAIDYVKQLKERVQELEKQDMKSGVGKVIVIEKPDLRGNGDTTNLSDITTSSDHDHDERSRILPDIAARALGKEVLIEIHCEKENGIELKILDHLENHHLSVSGSSVLPFGNSALSVTVIAQMGDAYGMTMNDLVSSLRQVVLKSQMSSDSDPY